MLLLWDRAGAVERARLEVLIRNCQNGALGEISALLAEHETLAPSQEAIHEHLVLARHALEALPESSGRTGLMGLTEYLAEQTDALGV